MWNCSRRGRKIETFSGSQVQILLNFPEFSKWKPSQITKNLEIYSVKISECFTKIRVNFCSSKEYFPKSILLNFYSYIWQHCNIIEESLFKRGVIMSIDNIITHLNFLKFTIIQLGDSQSIFCAEFNAGLLLEVWNK